MIETKRRRFLPSLLLIDVGDAACTFVESGFIAVNNSVVSKIEHTVNLNFEGDYWDSVIYYDHLGSRHIFRTQMNEDDAAHLLKICTNKHKRYTYLLFTDDRKDVHVNCYTLGLVIIDVDADTTKIPEYCGIEVTDDPKYHEANLHYMRAELRARNLTEERDKLIKKTKEKE